MGQWGFYDDEGDYVADVWISIEESILPEAPEFGYGSSRTMFDITRSNAINNPEKLYQAIGKWIEKHKNNKDKNEFDSMFIAGIALKVIRVLEKLPQSDPLGSGIFDSGIPEKLPNGYPEWLREEALHAVEISLNNTKLLSQWGNPKERKNALQHELFLFSNGIKGVNRNSFQKN